MNPDFRKKSAARLQAVQTVYLCLMRSDVSATEALQSCKAEQPSDVAVDEDFCKKLVLYWEERKDVLTEAISRHLTKSWSVERLDRVLCAIMQVGTAELYAFPHVDAALTVSEYLDVAHAFFQGDEYKIINGVLNAVAHNRA